MEEQNHKNVRIALDSPHPGIFQHAYLGYKQQFNTAPKPSGFSPTCNKNK
jgi:hypothetical protein